MKLNRIFIALTLVANSAWATPLDLFGVPLQGATRSTLEPALQKAGFSPIHVGNRWWFDSYYVHGQLPGASKLIVGYTQHNRFAMAQYIFPSFMDMGQVTKVIHMVSDKYGAPNRESGNPNLGNVTAVWNEGNGMIIRVDRGWPSTTTYLTIENVVLWQRMRAQMRAQKQQQEQAQSKAYANVF